MYVCFVLFPIDVTAIKCIISILCLFIRMHKQIVARLLFIKCESVSVISVLKYFSVFISVSVLYLFLNFSFCFRLINKISNHVQG